MWILQTPERTYTDPSSSLEQQCENLKLLGTRLLREVLNNNNEIIDWYLAPTKKFVHIEYPDEWVGQARNHLDYTVRLVGPTKN